MTKAEIDHHIMGLRAEIEALAAKIIEQGVEPMGLVEDLGYVGYVLSKAHFYPMEEEEL